MREEVELVRASVTDIIKRERESNEFKEKLQKMLNIPMGMALEDYYLDQGIDIGKGTLSDAIAASMILQAIHGNTTAYSLIRDTMGYKPVENVKNDVTIKIDMPKAVKELGE